MADTDEYHNANLELWEAWTPVNVKSDFYDIDAFKAGASTLDSVELAGFDDVSGKSLLHLQCHFGLDTLSWARRGAQVTGADFSPTAIATAKTLADELGLEAQFVISNIYDLPQNLEGRFDLVFTSHGVLGWLPDLRAWAQVISHFLEPGGTFYLVEIHPFILLFDDERDDANLRLRYPYFHQTQPLTFAESGSYADPQACVEGTSYNWVHSVSDIIDALLRSGLVLDWFREYPFMEWPHLKCMQQTASKSWVLPENEAELPLMFSLRATKPG